MTAHITVPDADPILVQVVGASPITGPFNITFPITAKTDLRVSVAGAELTQSGFSFTPTDIRDGGYQLGYVTLVAATSNSTVVVWRDMHPVRTTDFPNGPFDTVGNNTALDLLTAMTQDVRVLAQRSLRTPLAEATISELPVAAARKGGVLGFDSVTGAPMIAAGAGAGAPVSTAMLPVVQAPSIALGRAAFGVTPSGVVMMVRTGVGTWAVYAPSGTAIDISASTTSGLQEAINAMATYGANLHVMGGASLSLGQNLELITCNSAIVWPMMQGRSILIENCTIQFGGGVVGVGMTFDSCMMVDFTFMGQIGYLGNLSAVLFKPTTALLDGHIGFVDSRFNIKTVVTNGGTNPTGVLFDDTSGPIVNCEFNFLEVNGANGATVYGQHGIVFQIGSTNGFFGNRVKCPHLHKFSGGGLRVGNAATTGITGNIFDVTVLPSGAGSTGVQIYGQNNDVFCSIMNNEGVANEGVKLEAGASKNRVYVRNDTAATPINDVSTNKDNLIFYNGLIYNTPGIGFPATQLLSANVNTLDDYEEGTWTPTISYVTPGDLAVTYAINAATYLKVGNRIWLNAVLVPSSFTFTTASGALRIAGQPFTPAATNDNYNTGALIWRGITKAGFSDINAVLDAGAAYINFKACNSAAAPSLVVAADTPSGGAVYFSFNIDYKV